MRQRRLLVVAGLLGVATAVGVATASGQGEDRSGQERTERVRIALAGHEGNLTPFSMTFQSGMTINLINMVYDTLFYPPSEPDPQPWLAEDFDVSNGGRTWTVDVRDGVRWHDGKPLTAEDVRFTYEYFFENEQDLYSHHVNQLPFVERVERVDDDTVRFTCREPCPTFNIDPGALIPILPKHVWKAVEDPAPFRNATPVGSGPYEAVEVDPGRGYTLRANDGYFLGRPLVERIEMPIVPGTSEMFRALRSGDVDAVSRGAPPQMVRGLEKAGLEILKLSTYKSTQVNFNAQREPFDSADLRNALNLAVDTRPIAQAVLADAGQPGAESFLDPDSPFAAKELEDKYDVRAAEDLLAKAGYRDGDGDGVREGPNGKPLDLEILVSANEAGEVRASGLAADQLTRVGVRAKVVPLAPITFARRIRPPGAGRVLAPETEKTGDYDMYVTTSYEGGHVHFDPDGLLYYFHCPGKTGFGAYITGYCNEKFDRLVDRAASLGFDERTPLLQDAQRVLYDDPPVISLYFEQERYAYRPQAYAGWAPESGHGILHKRSFLPIEGVERVGSPSSADEAGGDGGTPVWVLVLVGLGVLVAGAVVMARRRRRAS